MDFKKEKRVSSEGGEKAMKADPPHREEWKPRPALGRSGGGARVVVLLIQLFGT